MSGSFKRRKRERERVSSAQERRKENVQEDSRTVTSSCRKEVYKQNEQDKDNLTSVVPGSVNVFYHYFGHTEHYAKKMVYNKET